MAKLPNVKVVPWIVWAVGVTISLSLAYAFGWLIAILIGLSGIVFGWLKRRQGGKGYGV